MSSLDPRSAAALGAAAALIVAGLAVAAARAARRRAASRRAVTRARRALAGERDATALLAAAGFEVQGTQCRTVWTFACDGEPVEIELRCDALVARDGRRLVAEVKTGDRAPSLATAATRRQLLEYAVAYRADGVLLVDPEAGVIRQVEFGLDLPSPAPAPAPPPPRALGWLAAGAVIGAGAASLLLSSL